MAIALACLTVFGSLLIAAPRASAPFTGLTVSIGQYSAGLPSPYTYVPDETFTITISGTTVGEQFDIAVYKPTSGQLLASWENVTITSSFSASVTYRVPAALPDGSDYAVGVGDGNWLPNPPTGSIGSPPLPGGTRQFNVQLYRLSLDVSRPAYVGGDTIIITWSANNLKGGGLAASAAAGCQTCGQLWVYDTSGARTSLITPSVYVFLEPSGTFSFNLRDPSNPAFDGRAEMWFNDTASNPSRFQWVLRPFFIDDLSVRANVNPTRTAPGGIVTTTVTTVTQPNRPPLCPTGCTEAGMRVDITVWQSGTILTSYGANDLTTDAHGSLTYVFKLDAAAPTADYVIRVNASNPSRILQRSTNVTFTVAVAANLVQVLQLDKTEYQAGDKATVTSVVTGASGTTLTWIFEVRDSSIVGCGVGTGAPLLLKATQSTNKLEYPIPTDFSSGTGVLCFLVTADNGQGTSRTDPISARVVFGWLLVNADRREYNPRDTITVSWDLVSNRITTPSYFYDVRDQNGNSVSYGSTGSDRSFQFAVPDPASTQYTFIVTATQTGRTVSNAPGLTLLQVGGAPATGFFISAIFDRSSYAPGDTMRIHYTISARSANSVPPPYYQISYGLANGGPLLVRSTSSSTGDLTYIVPQGMNEGDQGFTITEARTGASASEVVTIRATNPLQFVTVGDIPVLELIILIWVIIMTLLMWRKGMFSGMRAPKAPAGPSPPQEVHAPASSPMTVTCRSCGSPIEITTSKRPIEVMCPKCGNTEVVS